ncbi:TPA: hypothetical protein QDA82_000706 [Burkholderia vietnamiensis]|nr:hypothetical protein [Burkholderia vietnamiensis]
MDRTLNLLRLARERGVSLRGVAAMGLLALDAVSIGAAAVLFAWMGLLPTMYVLSGLVLMLCAASLLSSDLWQTDEERLDRHLGLWFRGERRAIAQAAYIDLWIKEADA